MSARVLVCTPVYGRDAVGMVAAHHANALWALARNEILEDRIEGTEAMTLGWVGTDIVRARSRFVGDFLADPSFTHLLFWDSDVVGDPKQIARCIGGMLAANKAIVGAPYPKKDVQIAKVAETGRAHHAHTYSFQVSKEQKPDATGCVRADWVSAGFTLIARSCLEQMHQHYVHDPELVYDDEFNGQVEKRETVALFQLINHDRVLLSEDYSFCKRWTDLGGEVHLYLGPGAPLDHVGGYRFRGDIRGILSPAQ